MGRLEVAKQSKSQIQVGPRRWAVMGFPLCRGPSSAPSSPVGGGPPHQGRGPQAALGQGRRGRGGTPDPDQRRHRDGVRRLGTAL